MIRKSAGTLTAAVLALGLGLIAVPLQTTTAVAAVARPASFGTVTSAPGPKPGEVTITWKHDGANTTGYEVETGLTSFSRSATSSLPLHGRGWKVFKAPGTARSLTLTAAQTAAAGAPVGSANHLYFRLRAVNTTGGTFRDYPYLQTVGVAPAVPATTGTPVRVASFNVRTARALTDDRVWLDRVSDVADSIIDNKLGLVALQELGPGRADGTIGTTTGHTRQTDSLVNELTAQGAGHYKLTRTTPYVKPGTTTATQGMRILYDTTKYQMLSKCVEKSTDGNYSPSCTIPLPIRPAGDTDSNRRKAAYAQFADKTTGDRFYFVSVHLDHRHSTNLTTEKTLDQLRAAQVKAAIDGVAAANTDNLPVILGGDLNTWQNNKVGHTAHQTLINNGYYDTAAAAKHTNLRYTTMNSWNETLTDPGTGFGARLDAILTQGITGTTYFENVMNTTDTTRPSDHNMVLADIRLPH